MFGTEMAMQVRRRGGIKVDFVNSSIRVDWGQSGHVPPIIIEKRL